MHFVPCDGLEGAHIWARVHLQALKLASVQVRLPPECVLQLIAGIKKTEI